MAVQILASKAEHEGLLKSLITRMNTAECSEGGAKMIYPNVSIKFQFIMN